MESVRAVLVVFTLASIAAGGGCAELGVITDGSSVSVGRTNGGYLVDGAKLPDQGYGFTTRENWSRRGNRYGTDELVQLLEHVARRMRTKVPDVRLVIADLSARAGGAERLFHRSHQTGRDVDLLYYMRDAAGKPFEADSMRKFDRHLLARDRSGISIDVPRTWLLVRELLTAQEATVQYIFMYQPIAQKVIEYAQSIDEDPIVIARAMKACKQPGDSAPHNDHLHVRIYCPIEDRQFGCVDRGRLELLAEREAERRQTLNAIAEVMPRREIPPGESAADVWAGTASVGTTTGTLGSTTAPSAVFSSLLRARADRIDLRGWR